MWTNADVLFCRANFPHLASVVTGSSSSKNNLAPLVQCTAHMCPIRVHWHVKLNYKEYWRVKITITNFNYRMNYTNWNLVVQHPNFHNLTQIFSFNYQSINPYGKISRIHSLFISYDLNIFSVAVPSLKFEYMYHKNMWISNRWHCNPVGSQVLQWSPDASRPSRECADWATFPKGSIDFHVW